MHMHDDGPSTGAQADLHPPNPVLESWEAAGSVAGSAVARWWLEVSVGVDADRVAECDLARAEITDAGQDLLSRIYNDRGRVVGLLRMPLDRGPIKAPSLADLWPGSTLADSSGARTLRRDWPRHLECLADRQIFLAGSLEGWLRHATAERRTGDRRPSVLGCTRWTRGLDARVPRGWRVVVVAPWVIVDGGGR